MTSLVTIIIPTYNRAHLLSRSLDSVISQSYQNWECLVIDDGSTDYTAELITLYCEVEERIQFLKRPAGMRKGASSCRNYGLSKARGEFIQFLDSDDLISSEKIELQTRLLIDDPDSSIATCTWGRFTKSFDDAEIYKGFKSYKDFEELYDFFDSLKVSLGFFPIHAYLIRRIIIDEAGHWNEYLTMNDDGEFMIRVLLKSKKMVFSEEALALYRYSSGENISSYTDEEKIINALRSLKMIETALKIRFNQERIPYVERNKKEFYNLIQHLPHLIKQNKMFFKEQIEYDSWKSLSYRFLTRFYSRWISR